MGRRDKAIPFEDGEEGLPLGARLRDARQQQGISLTQMAKDLGYTKSHLSAVENGTGRPSLQLVERYEQMLGLGANPFALREGDQALPGHRQTSPFAAKDARASEKDLRGMQRARKGQVQIPSSTPSAPILARRNLVEDWGEAPAIRNLYGRERELAELRQWIVNDHCRLIALLGIGGVGKTVLASEAARELVRIKGEFKAVIWRSLVDVPSIEEVLKACIRCFSGQRHVQFPTQRDEQIALFIEYLQRSRFLVVLDNFESVLQAGSLTKQYRKDSETYGELLERVGKAKHQSCLLLTSREQPIEAALEVETTDIRSLVLAGVGEEGGYNLLKTYDLVGSDNAFAELTKLYSGNPLALKLVAAPIQDLFESNIDAFLNAFRSREKGKEGAIMVGAITHLLSQQFQRLSEQEQDIMYWLAIEREAVSLNSLADDSIRLVSQGRLFQTLEMLRRRSMIESGGSGRFTLQPAIMEYIIESFLNRVYEEIASEKIEVLASHALMKAQAKDYVRGIQKRLLLAPLAQRLLTSFGKEESEKKLKNLLSQLKRTHLDTPGYAAGNILNLLIQLGCHLQGYDFSRLAVWQAYLQGTDLPEVNFTHAELGKSVFTDTFERVLTVKLSPNGMRLAAGTGNGDVHLWAWDASRNMLTPLYICRGHTDWVRSIAFSSDGETLASGSDDQTIRIWEVETGRCLQTLQGSSSRVFAVSLHHSERIVAAGNQDGSVCVWDWQTQQRLWERKDHTDRVWSVAFSPKSDVLASGSSDKTVGVWKSKTGDLLWKREEHTHRVRSVAFSSDGALLASGSKDGTVRIWNARAGECRQVIKTQAGVTSVDFLPNSRIIASGSEDAMVRLWNVDTMQPIRTFEGHKTWIRSVSFSADGKTLASSSEDQTVRLWEADTGRCLKALQGYTEWVYAVAFSPDGKVIASCGGNLVVRLWDVSTGQTLKKLQGHTNWARSVAFSFDGELLASGGEDQRVYLWRVSTGERLRTLEGHPSWVYAVAFSPDGKMLASGSEDKTVHLWNVSTGQTLKKLQGHTNWVRSIAFSPDGELLASGGEDRRVCLWKVSTGERLETVWEHSSRVYAVAFSPDGETVASGSEDSLIKLWDVHTKQCRQTLNGHTGRVWATAFSPDGMLIASGSEDLTVRLWDANTGQCLNTFSGFDNRVYSTAFSPDGKTVAGGSHDGTVKLWAVETGKLVRTLRKSKPYEGMNITGVEGLMTVQKDMLKTLGAIEK